MAGKRKRKKNRGREVGYRRGKPRDIHFKSEKAYRKFLAYIHIHRIPHRKGRYVYIGGRKHKVKHK